MRKIISELRLPEDKMIMLPNGVDLEKFRPLDKKHARQVMGIPENVFVVGSVGNFLYKKGIARVGEAIKGMDDVIGIFAGSGSLPPAGKNVLWAKKVAHDQLPLMLSACDVFVLPTLIEGCCNAIIEAIACGLPIISSVGEFNDDLLDESMSIRVDPLNIDAIKKAIKTLRDNEELRKKMSVNAQEKAKLFNIKIRINKILNYMFNHVT
jgi:glycosyltransferase involved in cell wall biosynthesis